MSTQDRPETPITEQPKRPKEYDTRIDDRIDGCRSQLAYWTESEHEEFPREYVEQQRTAWAERLMQALADAKACRASLAAVPPLVLSPEDQWFIEWEAFVARKTAALFQLSADELAASGDVNAAYALSAKQQQQRAWGKLQPRLAAADHALHFGTAISPTTESDDPQAHEA